MQSLKYFAMKLKEINFNTVYLAGGIQSAKSPNSWRDPVTTFFTINGRETFNPVSDNTLIFNQSILGYKDDTPLILDDLQSTDELKEALLLRQTEINDMRAIKKADLIFFYLDDRAGHGTKTEFDRAYDWKKPIIIVRSVSRKNLAHWNKWRRYYGLVIDNNMIEFKNLTEMKGFFVKYLDFKDVGGSNGKNESKIN